MTKKNIGITIDSLIERVSTYMSEEEIGEIKKAYEYASKMHFGVKRLTGENYIEHPLNVAYILTDINADCPTICAGLLHDILEDCDVTKQEFEDIFGKEITTLVDGVTKINKLNFDVEQAATIATQKKQAFFIFCCWSIIEKPKWAIYNRYRVLPNASEVIVELLLISNGRISNLSLRGAY